MLRSYKYRIYPNKEQQKKIEQTLETCRRYFKKRVVKYRNTD